MFLSCLDFFHKDAIAGKLFGRLFFFPNWSTPRTKSSYKLTRSFILIAHLTSVKDDTYDVRASSMFHHTANTYTQKTPSSPWYR